MLTNVQIDMYLEGPRELLLAFAGTMPRENKAVHHSRLLSNSLQVLKH